VVYQAMRRVADRFFGMEPTLMKPRIIMAHVEGSGTGSVSVGNWPSRPTKSNATELANRFVPKKNRWPASKWSLDKKM
jgi:hypothetical protein